MRLFEFTGSVWLDTTWHTHFKKSWKVRKYWLHGHRNTTESKTGDKKRYYKIQLGPFTLNLTVKLVLRSNPNE